mmetsp:Transcript_16153/g.43833  ORF Transcript_16153/g.43833 Transcript_16153/m.43833 type:complete len:623 (-) Transcript_16153:4347-6215(-)
MIGITQDSNNDEILHVASDNERDNQEAISVFNFSKRMRDIENLQYYRGEDQDDRFLRIDGNDGRLSIIQNKFTLQSVEASLFPLQFFYLLSVSPLREIELKDISDLIHLDLSLLSGCVNLLRFACNECRDLKQVTWRDIYGANSLTAAEFKNNFRLVKLPLTTFIEMPTLEDLNCQGCVHLNVPPFDVAKQGGKVTLKYLREQFPSCTALDDSVVGEKQLVLSKVHPPSQSLTKIYELFSSYLCPALRELRLDTSWLPPDSASRVLKRMIDDSTTCLKVLELRLPNSSWNSDLDALHSSLISLRGLTTLGFSNAATPSGLILQPQSRDFYARLSSLDLRISDQTIKAWKHLLGNDAALVKWKTLNGCTWKPEKHETIFKDLGKIEQRAWVSKVNVSGLRLGVQCWKQIFEGLGYPQLQQVNEMAFKSFHHGGTVGHFRRMFKKSLGLSKKLVFLDSQDCLAPALAALHYYSGTLTALDLSGNALGDNVHFLCEALVGLTLMSSLDLRGNGFDTSSWNQLATVLSRLSMLQSVNGWSNDQALVTANGNNSQAGARHVNRLLFEGNLKELSLCGVLAKHELGIPIVVAMMNKSSTTLTNLDLRCFSGMHPWLLLWEHYDLERRG